MGESVLSDSQRNQENVVWNVKPAHPLPTFPLKGEEWRAQRSSVLKGAVLTKTVRSFTTREGLKTLY